MFSSFDFILDISRILLKRVPLPSLPGPPLYVGPNGIVHPSPASNAPLKPRIIHRETGTPLLHPNSPVFCGVWCGIAVAFQYPWPAGISSSFLLSAL